MSHDVSVVACGALRKTCIVKRVVRLTRVVMSGVKRVTRGHWAVMLPVLPPPRAVLLPVLPLSTSSVAFRAVAKARRAN